MAGKILSSSGVPLRPVGTPDVVTSHNAKLPQIDDTLGPAELAELDFVPLGHYMIGEAIAPDSISEGGIHTPYGTGDKPMYRLLRLGQRSAYPAEYAHLAKGDVIFDRSVEQFELIQNFPRLPKGDVRRLMILRLMAAEGVWEGYRWNDLLPETEDPPLSPDRRLSFNMQDFEKTYVDAVRARMMQPSDLDALDLKPIGANLIIEHAPPKNITGSIVTPDNAMPLYRILRVPTDKTSFPVHMRFLEPGDFVMISMLDRRSEIPHTVPPSPNSDKRRLYLTNVGGIVGWYPSLSWRFREEAEKNTEQCCKIEDVTACYESHT